MVKECFSVQEFIQRLMSSDVDSVTHCQDAQDPSAPTGVKREGTTYVIRLYHSQQAFCIAEKQFLNQDHHKLLDSEVKHHHMLRNSPMAVKCFVCVFFLIICCIFLQYLGKHFKLL